MLRINDAINASTLQGAAALIYSQRKPGIDGITPREFRLALKETDLADSIVEQIMHGSYTPRLLRLVTIPKPNGTNREIFIPTVQDSAVQKAIVAALTVITESRFHPNSFGFRPGRNVNSAVMEASRLVKDGYTFCLLVDLKNFFGSIERDRIRKLLRDYALDDELRKLINAFITAKVKGRNSASKLGIPAGIPLAPTLANIYLHPLDRELTRQGINFVRYADDITLFFKTESDCQQHLLNFWGRREQQFGIIVNHDKTETYYEDHRPILGFSIDKLGGVTVTRTVTDKIRKSLFGLLAEPWILSSKINRINQRFACAVHYYQKVENFKWFKSELNKIREELCDQLAQSSEFEILNLAEISINRIDDIYDHDFYEIIKELVLTI